MAEPRTLPHRSEAETAILGGILLRGSEALDEVLDLIDAEDFYAPARRAVFEVMLQLVERGQAIDVVALEDALRKRGQLELVGGIEGLARLDRYATAHNIRIHAELVASAARTRRIVVACRDGAERGMEPDVDDDGFADQVASAVEEAARDRRSVGPRTTRTLIPGVFQSIVDRQRAGARITGVPTGFFELDDLTAGLQPKDLIILAARPSMGKTAFALNLAANACVPKSAHFGLPFEQQPRRFPVLFFSLEMGAEQLTERLICAEARIDSKYVRTGRRLLEIEYRGMIAAADRIAHAAFTIDDSASPSVLEMRARARRWRRESLAGANELGVVMIDYLQLARGGKPRYDSREQEISDISRGLKAMAKELRVPVIALSQLNRAVVTRADHRPQMSDLRESGSLEQDADVIMFVHREEMFLSADAPDEKRRALENKAELIVGKQRNGELGVVHLHYLGRQTRFVEPAQAQGF